MKVEIRETIQISLMSDLGYVMFKKGIEQVDVTILPYDTVIVDRIKFSDKNPPIIKPTAV